MRFQYGTAVAVTMMTVSGCGGSGSGSNSSASLETEDEKASYAIGLDVGNSLQPAGDHLQMSSFLRGLEDALAEREPAVATAELQEVMQRFGQQIQEEQQAEQAQLAETNRTEGESYLAENGGKDGVVTTDSGLQYEVLREGDGPTPQPTESVTIHYRGTLLDGTEFDSSYERDPATFAVGGVIPGFSEGLQTMNVGSHYRFFIPSDLGYGPQGSGQVIGPNATLVFEVELLGIE